MPLDAKVERWLWLSLSVVVGLVTADARLFRALILTGPRLTILMMSLVSVSATLKAWVIYEKPYREATTKREIWRDLFSLLHAKASSCFLGDF